MSKHSITYQDDGAVGVKCSTAPNDTWTINREIENPKTCPHCGSLVLLVWHVYLVETES